MTTASSCCRRFPAVLALTALLGAAPAWALSQRTFVASVGVNGNPCSITQPCRSIGAAIVQTSPGGEVIVLDSAGYGPFAVDRAISVIAPPGIYAGITVTNGNGITVSTGSSDVVVLRGLSINGQGGAQGVSIVSAKQVHIEDCTISNMGQEGIFIEGGNYVRIAGTTLRSNVGSGVRVSSANSNSLTLAIEYTRAVGNGFAGFLLRGGSQVTLHNVQAIDNVAYGVQVDPNVGVPNVAIVNGEFSGNGDTGIRIDGKPGISAGLSIHGISASRNGGSGLSISSASNNPPWSVVNASISHSHVTWNGFSGLATISVFQSINFITVAHSVFSENGVYGIESNEGPGNVVNVSANSVSRNGDYDLAQTYLGQLNTFGNNALTGSGAADTFGSLTGKSLR
jgi:hypothetical protein